MYPTGADAATTSLTRYCLISSLRSLIAALTPEQPFNCLVALSIHFSTAARLVGQSKPIRFRLQVLFLVVPRYHYFSTFDPVPPDHHETLHVSLSTISRRATTRIGLVIPYHKRRSLKQPANDRLSLGLQTPKLNTAQHCAYSSSRI